MADLKFVADFSDIQTMRRELVGVAKDAKQSAGVFEREYNKAERQVQKTAKANQEFFNSVMGLNKANKDASKSASVFAQELQRQEKATAAYSKEITRLRSKYVEGYGASQKFKKEIRDLIQAKRKGIITTDQYGDAVQRLKTDFRDFQGGVVKGSNQFANYNTSVYQANQKTKRFASVGLQQAGYQVGDFAVQLQGGTNAAVAFGQQGSQLLGIFGAGGAIAGAALAITTAFVAPLLDAKKAAEDFETALQSMSTAVSSAKQALDLHKMSVVELTDKYGLLAFEARQASVEIARADYRGALSDLRDFSIPILEDMVEAMELYNQTELFSSESNQASQQLRDIREELQLSASEFNRLQDAYTEFQNASTLSQQVEAAIGLRDAFSEIPEEVLQSDKELNKMVGSVAKLFLEGSELKDLMSELEDSTPGSNWMDSAITGVNGLINRVIEGINKVRTLKGEAKEPSFVERYEAGEFTGTPNVSGFRSAEYFNLLDRQAMDAGKSGGSGGAGGGSGVDPVEELNRAKEAVDQLRASYDEQFATSLKVAEAQEKVNELIKLNPELTGEANQVLQDYISSLNQAESPLKKIGETLKSSLGDAFMSIVDGSKSAGDAFKDMARLVLKQAFELLVIKPILDGIFGSFGGGGGGGLFSFLGFANGAAFNNGKVTAFADGGVVNQPTMFPMANGAGLMGEAGPEAIMPLKRGKGGKLGVQMEGGNQGNVTVENHFHIAANGDESVKRIIQQEAPKIANYTQQQIMDQRRRGGAMKSTFGG